MSTGVMIMTVTLLILLFIKVPVFVAILGASAVYFVLTPGINPAVFAQQAITGAESVTLLAIPFFVCAGVLMNYTGVTRRIMDFCAVLTGRMYGGLSQVNILLSTLMGGLSGSALADAAMEAKMLVPEMEKKGIGRAFSTVVTAASSMITPLIPPGIGLILYGCIANVSIGKLFVAGFGPGILLCATMMFMVSRISKKRGYMPLRTEKMHAEMFWRSFRPAVLPLCLPIIIIGGVRLGIFTATEAGAVAIVYAALLGIIYRELGIKEIAQGLKETLQTTSSIMLIVAAASTFSWILTKEMIPQRFTEWMIQMINNKWLFLIAVDIFLIFVGMFVEGNASMIVLVPLFAPAAAAYGIDSIHFAMVFIFANAIGAFTPPMGTLMFVACGVTKCSTKDFIKEAVPFYALLFGCLLILTFIPLFSTGLVNLIY
ncbi:Neu5Ac permease [uncultured Clostridium sp.]|jgi:tripartite ATP-independent transporter DctM subunit|uniref:TRAP transporter large permease n=1 Tax=Enterocloster citroniae TaxID=358743 RepID=UPI0008214BE2|nr:TRAP transporter large permease [Enterocloster citroniae]MCB7065251.1 TRAP transporter large permease [Enterocloster citroniae]SCI09853.1 Neu5Ac permease [uncultured Clostridium sp.]